MRADARKELRLKRKSFMTSLQTYMVYLFCPSGRITPFGKSSGGDSDWQEPL